MVLEFKSFTLVRVHVLEVIWIHLMGVILWENYATFSMLIDHYTIAISINDLIILILWLGLVLEHGVEVTDHGHINPVIC